MLFRLLTLLPVFLLAFAAYPAAHAQEAVPGFRSTELPLPRYVSIRSDKAYARAGPALRYPIKWIYKRDGLPVEIVQEFDNWRKIRDFEGEEGWVHMSLLSGERTALVMGDALVSMREGFSQNARLVARIEPMVVASLEKCSEGWCRIEAGGYRGWVQRNSLWGIYENEELN